MNGWKTRQQIVVQLINQQVDWYSLLIFPFTKLHEQLLQLPGFVEVEDEVDKDICVR